MFAWWFQVRHAKARSSASRETHFMPSRSAPTTHESLEVNGVPFEMHIGTINRGVQGTSDEFIARCVEHRGNAVPAVDRNHGFVLCSYPTLPKDTIHLRFTYVRGNHKASTYTEIWSKAPFSPQRFFLSSHGAPLNTRLHVSSESMDLAVHASALSPRQLVTLYRRQLQAISSNVEVSALSRTRFVLHAARGAYSKTLLISEHPQWTSAVTALETKGRVQ